MTELARGDQIMKLIGQVDDPRLQKFIEKLAKNRFIGNTGKAYRNVVAGLASSTKPLRKKEMSRYEFGVMEDLDSNNEYLKKINDAVTKRAKKWTTAQKVGAGLGVAGGLAWAAPQIAGSRKNREMSAETNPITELETAMISMANCGVTMGGWGGSPHAGKAKVKLSKKNRPLQTPSNEPTFNLARGDILKKVLPDVVNDPFWERAKKGGFLQSEAAGKLKEAMKLKRKGNSSGFVFGSLERGNDDRFGVVLLGVPSDFLTRRSRALDEVQKRLTAAGGAEAEGLASKIFGKSVQDKAPMAGAIPNFPGGSSTASAGLGDIERDALDKKGTYASLSILQDLMKKNRPRGY